jgi:Lar family restriction alleviation protein
MKLKPCPFCGENPVMYPLTPEATKRWAEIWCINVNCPTKPHLTKYGNTLEESKEMASEAWNKRA